MEAKLLGWLLPAYNVTSVLEVTSVWRFPEVIGRSWTRLLTATLKSQILHSFTIIVFNYNYHIPSAFELWWYNDSHLFVSHPPLFYDVQTPRDGLTAQANEKCAMNSVTLNVLLPLSIRPSTEQTPHSCSHMDLSTCNVLLLGRSWVFMDVTAAKTLFAVVTCEVDESIHLGL